MISRASDSIIRLFDYSIIRKSHPAFTLVELIVVVAIIGILAGVLLASFGGSSESARAAQCLANMKNLANACQTYGAAYGSYPRCLAYEKRFVEFSYSRPQTIYEEHKAWISWNSQGNYSGGRAKSAQSNPTIGFRTSDKEQAIYALTNGCLWTYVARNRATYVCPNHVKKCGKTNPPIWSYLMNSKVGGVAFGKLDRADRFLLFSEIPFQSWHSWCPDGKGSGTADDPALQYSSSSSGEKGAQSSGSETIGANHFNGKNLFAHVAFADGHVEKLRIPYTGSVKNPKVDEAQLKNLTTWLCSGFDVSFDGKQYQKMDN